MLKRKNSAAERIGGAPDGMSMPAEPTFQAEGVDASQLMRAAEAAAFAGHGNRPRPKIIVPPAQMEEALQLTTQGKVTAKNAWAVPLIEGMADSLGSCLDDDADQYVTFTKAAHLVEGGAKVWTHRVDSTYLLSAQMVRRLLRNDTRDEGDGDEDDAARADGEGQPTRRRRKMAERTLADTVDEINQEGTAALVASHIAAYHSHGSALPPQTGAKGALAAHGALFRAVTEKFDQGHAQGLLLNNTRVGAAANLVLDRDFSTTNNNAAEPAAAGHSVPAPVAAAAAPEQGPPMEEDVDTPVFNLSSGARVSEGELQVAANTLLTEANVAALAQGPTMDFEGAVAPPETAGPGSRAPSVFNRGLGGGGNDSDDGDAGGWDDGDGADDDGGPAWDEADQNRFARAVVEGGDELDAIDAHFNEAIGGRNNKQTALAAEDPNSWVPLSHHVASKLRRGGLMASIRSKVVTRGPKAETEEVQQAKKARAERKRVQFIGATVGGTAKELDTSAEALEPDLTLLADAKKPSMSLTPFGKRVLDGKEQPKAYTDFQYGMKRAAGNNLLLPEALRAPLPRWCGAETASHVHQVEDFFQHFGASEAHWNILKKTVRAIDANAAGGGIKALPVLDADQGGAFDDDDYGGEPDDHSDDGGFWPGLQQTEAAPDLPELDADDDAGIDLIPEPEQMKALKVQTATAPTMVDVVKLRSAMWHRTSALARRRGVAPSAEQLSAVAAPAHVPTGRTMFSDVITAMLPDVPQIARDGSLSPAFFFFSLLFLANEHGLDLRQVVGDEELQRALVGHDPAGDCLDDGDDDTPIGRIGTAQVMRRAHESHVGGLVERVGCDVVIKVPTATKPEGH